MVMEQMHFFKNLAIFGGLLYVLSEGAGTFAFDAWRSYCQRTKKDPYDAVHISKDVREPKELRTNYPMEKREPQEHALQAREEPLPPAKQ